MNDAFGQSDFCDVNMLPAEPPRNDGNSLTQPWLNALALATASIIILAL